MAFPEGMLAEGERLLVHERPHPKTLLAPAVVFVLVCGVVGYLAAFLRRESWRGLGWTVLAVVATALVLWYAVVPLARWLGTHFVVTDRRVLVREGVLRRVGFEIPTPRIESVSFRQTVLERMLRCGTLTIGSASESGSGPVEFDEIPHVQRVCLALRDATTPWA